MEVSPKFARLGLAAAILVFILTMSLVYIA